MAIKGQVWKYGDDINTDVIFPGKYTYTVSDPVEMGEHAIQFQGRHLSSGLYIIRMETPGFVQSRVMELVK